VAGKALRVFHPELYYHPNLQTVAFLWRILITSVLLICFFLPPVRQRNEASNLAALKNVKIIFLVAAAVWGFLIIGWLIGGFRHGTEENVFTEGLLMGLPWIILASIASLAQNWTISGKLMGASGEISPKSNDVG
jgi:hypothetical protein